MIHDLIRKSSLTVNRIKHAPSACLWAVQSIRLEPLYLQSGLPMSLDREQKHD